MTPRRMIALAVVVAAVAGGVWLVEAGRADERRVRHRRAAPRSVTGATSMGFVDAC